MIIVLVFNGLKVTGRKLNVHKTFRRPPGRLLNVLCTVNLQPVSRGYSAMNLVYFIFTCEPILQIMLRGVIGKLFGMVLNTLLTGLFQMRI